MRFSFYKLSFLIFLAIITIITIFVSVVRVENDIPVSCLNNCVNPYGVILGISSKDVKAYSNCQSGCVNFEFNTINGVGTGLKWQCVEYARRWLLLHKGLVYGDVETAADIWDKVNHLTHVATNTKIPLESFLNGSKHSPRIGDLLIYARAFNDTGHVAVVTDVNYKKGVIEVAEQNYRNEKWPDDYARTVEFIIKDDSFWLLDGYILGWKQISD